jgi:amino acid transporter
MATPEGRANADGPGDPAGPRPSGAGSQPVKRAVQVFLISSAMFTFISYWRVAAVVLCDLASTAYYIGGIVEQAIGPAAPWFILAVMLFSYAVRSVYIESCSMFVRGGVYRVVKEAMGGFLAKVSVSALMFDYVLTGPISGVSAGQYIVGLVLETVTHLTGRTFDPGVRDAWRQGGAVVIACAITLYFFSENLIGIRESSGKALNIMKATTVMAVVLLAWCGLTLLVQGPQNAVPLEPNLAPKPDPTTGELINPLGFLGGTALADHLGGLRGSQWLSMIGLIGLFIAFGHSVLAMSGEETLAQVYREVEAPKLANFRKAAFIVFLYSLVLTAGISFLAVLLIPNDVRMKVYADNLIGGLAMSVIGPIELKLVLNAFVVVVGFLILAGAVNTAIIGSNGVLNRVAEDGVMPEWFLKPHPRYGTTYRVLYLILGMQLFTILISRGNVLVLGEAYAFGVVWSFVFKALAMVVLRFKKPEHREYQVPFNIRVGSYQVPIGLSLIFLVLLVSAVMNLLTKEVATKWGLGFTAAFMTIFLVTERYREKTHRETKHEHLEQFNIETKEDFSEHSLGLTKPRRLIVAIRSFQSLSVLEKVLNEVDPKTTDVIVLFTKVLLPAQGHPEKINLDIYQQQLMTAVVERAEKAGKEVKVLVVPTNIIWHAVLKTAKTLRAQEVVIEAHRRFRAHDVLRWSGREIPSNSHLGQVASYWESLNEGQTVPLTVRVVSRNKEVRLHLGSGSTTVVA